MKESLNKILVEDCRRDPFPLKTHEEHVAVQTRINLWRDKVGPLNTKNWYPYELS